ncbi:MAG: hypothetical protein KAQ83_02545 [Nanoarchaeota archaeon]|nr:hypothetical protein [Nanoarchaeota archaeon]
MKKTQIIENIKKLNIQGAQNITIYSLDYIEKLINEGIFKDSEDLIKRLDIAIKKLIETRPTEPCMRNTLNYVHDVSYQKDFEGLKNNILSRIEEARKHFKGSDKKIVIIGVKKIKKGMKIFTHCHSATTIKILKEAKKLGINFEVYNTETRPRLQGRISAEELSNVGIKVNHYVDSSIIKALKEVDLVLIGCDAVLSTGEVVNKIGTQLIAEIADKYDIPLYVCTNSWKFDPVTIKGYDEVIEERNVDEVWPNPPKNVKIHNSAFDIIGPEHITGIISELGVYPSIIFIEEVRREYLWMFD